MEINAQTIKRAEVAWSAFFKTITSTSIIYLSAQLCLAVICLLGILLMFGLENSFVLTAADTLTFGSVSGLGAAMYLLGGASILICGFSTFVISVSIFYYSKIDPFRGLSVFILAICTVGLLIPILNIFPLMWLWNLYVAWTNLKN